MVITSIEPERFVFVDECSTNTHRWHPFLRMGAKRRAGAPKSAAQLGQEHNALLSSIGKRGWVWEHLWWWRVRRTGRFSRPTPGRCSVPHAGEGPGGGVMDNLSSHKGERVKELIEGRGSELIYLPPYSRQTTSTLKRASLQSKLSRAIFARSVRS
jgi:hypothetical protein